MRLERGSDAQILIYDRNKNIKLELKPTKLTEGEILIYEKKLKIRSNKDIFVSFLGILREV